LRNAQQDAALARQAPGDDLMKAVATCGGASSNSARDPESYLRIRDYLFRLR
jgi:hypothetical protein